MTRCLPLLLAAASCLPAEYLRIEMEFGGIDCASCSGFIESKLTRNRNIQSVAVDKQKGLLTLELKPENKMRLEQVRDLVQQSGFTPGATRVLLRGLAQPDGEISIPELGQSIKTADPKGILKPHAGKRVRVHGDVTTPSAAPPTLTPSKVEPIE